MRCIAVDDEPFALELIAGYIQKTPSLQCLGAFTNPFEAMAFLVRTPVDVVFLDIHMPELSGLELLKALPVLPKVVFTTAHAEFGAESYDFNAVDFLLKPVKYDRFLKAVNKASGYAPGDRAAPVPGPPADPPGASLLVKSGAQKFRIDPDDLFYVEGAGNYVTFHTQKGKVTALLSLHDVLKMLPGNTFVRIHKSYIVSLKQVGIVERASVTVNNRPIPIGITYREQFARIIQNN